MNMRNVYQVKKAVYEMKMLQPGHDLGAFCNNQSSHMVCLAIRTCRNEALT